MGKVSVGLRGWRFDESEILRDEEFKPLDEIPLDARQRLVRLTTLIDKPCDACYLIHGESKKANCNRARVVYGEPGEEVLLCNDHEPDFIYWYQECGGSELRGSEAFADTFYEWFEDGGRAPEQFGGIEHVETEPDELPELPDANDIRERLEENYEPHQIDLREYADDTSADSTADDDLEEITTSYPTDE